MKRTILGLLAVLAFAGSALAQVNLSNMPPNTVVARSGINPGPAQAIPFNVLAAALQLSVAINCPPHNWINAVSIAGAFTCSQPSYSDISGTVPLPSQGQFTVLGNNTTASAVPTAIPSRIKITSALTLFVRTAGNDTNCTGLSNTDYVSGVYPQACALASLSQASTTAFSNYDAGISSVTIKVTGTLSVDTAHVLAVNGPFVGGGQPSAITLDGGGTGFLNGATNTVIIQSQFGGVLSIKNITINAGSGGMCLSTHFGAITSIDGVTCTGSSATNGFFTSDRSELFFAGAVGPIVLSGTFTGNPFVALNGSVIVGESATISIGANLTSAGFMLIQGNSVSQWNGTTINLNAHTVTGPRFQLADGGRIHSLANDGNLTAFPGTTPGTCRGLCQYDGMEPTIPQTVANLGPCASASEGQMASVTDSNTATWGVIVAAGGVNHVGVYCNGTNWTVMAK